MKKVIEGIRYDTERATEVCKLGEHYGGRDFRSWSGTLHVTPRSGRWFIAGEGGPMSMFAQSTGNGTSGGSDIIPLTEDRARELLESAGKVEIIERYAEVLGMIDADDPRSRTIRFRVTDSEDAKLRADAESAGRTISQHIRAALGF
jgi:hypothetical protein